MKQTLRFPHGFLWGAATASYQVEGGIENCDWAEAARQGKVPLCGAACDHYNRYEQDFNLAQKLAHNAHKISLEWARIEPEEGKFNQAEVIHYKNAINALRVRGLEPIVCIWHFTLPTWFSHDGGFENSKSPARFARYAEFCANEILGDVRFVQTMNEPMIWAQNSYFSGNWPPFISGAIPYYGVVSNLIRAHKKAYVAIKKHRPQTLISISKNNIFFEATVPNPYSQIKAAVASWWWNRRFINKTRHHLDFIGLNYYFYIPFGPKPELPKTEMGWDIYPEGIYHVLRELGRYKLPVYIIENGIADARDQQRGEFIINHLAQIHRAIQDGVDVRGYLHWSLLDNYEWSFGFTKRFGLVEIDFVTQERRVRPSAYIFKNICETNSVEIEQP